MTGNFLDIIITGLILGGLYTLIAVGLSLQYGVGRVLNVAHGEFIMVGAFATFSLFTMSGISPLMSIAIVSPALFFIGYAVYWLIFKYLRRTSDNEDIYSGRSLLASFGLMFVVQNLILIIWGPDLRGYTYLDISTRIFGSLYSVNRLATLGIALGVSLGFYLFIRTTRIGKAIRAASEDPDMAHVLGVNIYLVLGACFGLGTAMAGLAGILISIMFDIQSAMGLEFTIIAIVVVVLGGLGSINGSMIGGFVLGLITAIVNAIDPSLSLISFYLIFMLLLLIKPTGMFGRQIDERA